MAAAAGFHSTKDKPLCLDSDVSRYVVSSFLEICCQSESCLWESLLTVPFTSLSLTVTLWHSKQNVIKWAEQIDFFWIISELDIVWRQSKSLDYSCQWPFAYASFVDIYNKFSHYINACVKKTIKKHCFNKGEIETTGGGTFFQGFRDIWTSESKDFLFLTL